MNHRAIFERAAERMAGRPKRAVVLKREETVHEYPVQKKQTREEKEVSKKLEERAQRPGRGLKRANTFFQYEGHQETKCVAPVCPSTNAACSLVILSSRPQNLYAFLKTQTVSTCSGLLQRIRLAPSSVNVSRCTGERRRSDRSCFGRAPGTELVSHACGKHARAMIGVVPWRRPRVRCL